METSMPALSHWESFYVIVGSSAAALTGLMFVVITLIADSKQPRTLKEINAFATPAVVHSSSVCSTSTIAAARSPSSCAASRCPHPLTPSPCRERGDQRVVLSASRRTLSRCSRLTSLLRTRITR